MGANLHIRKPGGASITREDILYLVPNCPYCDLCTFIEKRYRCEFEGFLRSKGISPWKEEDAATITPVVAEIPDKWLKTDGVFLYSICYSSRSDLGDAFGIYIPIERCLEEGVFAWQNCQCQDQWMPPGRLGDLLEKVSPEVRESEEYSDYFRMLKAVADRGFECQWDS